MTRGDTFSSSPTRARAHLGDVEKRVTRVIASPGRHVSASSGRSGEANSGAHDQLAVRRFQPPAVEVAIDSGVTVEAGDVPQALLEAWLRAFTIANPAHLEAIRQGRSTGNVPRELCGYERVGDRIRFCRGGIARLRQIASAHGVPLTYVDARNVGEPVELKHTRELRDYQARAVGELAKRQQGIVVAPAGAGKTSIACGFVARIRRSTLVLVGTVDLAEQWRAEVCAQLGVECGIIGAGKSEVRDVTVAIVASLAQMDADVLRIVMAPFGALIIDEAHHAASATWARVIDCSAAKYRIGLTATPEREDGTTPLLEWLIGPYVDTVDHCTLLGSGRLIAPTITELHSPLRFVYRGPDDWVPLCDALVADAARNRLIVDAVCADATAGHSVLVLTGRVTHAEELAAAVGARGIYSAALHGKTPKRLRTRFLEQARAGDLSVLVSTQLADEGLDLPRLSRLYLTFPARAAGRLEQRIGRIMRPHEDKLAPAVVDVVDVHIGVLRHQARQRARVFASVLGERPEMERSA